MGAAVNYYPHHIGDYSRDTSHLSMHEDGAYRRLLDLYYTTEKPLPTEHAKIYRLTRAISKSDRQCIDTILGEFFSKDADGYHHKRCDTEIAKARDKSNKARASIEARWKNERNTNVSGSGVRPYNEGNTPNNQEPITKNQRKEETSQDPPNGGTTLWDFGVTLLGEQGVKEGAARGFIGSLLRDYEEQHVEAAIRAAVGKLDAKSYISAVLRDKPKKGQLRSIV